MIAYKNNENATVFQGSTAKLSVFLAARKIYPVDVCDPFDLVLGGQVQSPYKLSWSWTNADLSRADIKTQTDTTLIITANSIEYNGFLRRKSNVIDTKKNTNIKIQGHCNGGGGGYIQVIGDVSGTRIIMSYPSGFSANVTGILDISEDSEIYFYQENYCHTYNTRSIYIDTISFY